MTSGVVRYRIQKQHEHDMGHNESLTVSAGKVFFFQNISPQNANMVRKTFKH